MSRAEQFVKDCTRHCSNELCAAGQNIVVLEDYTEKELGKMIWEDVDFTMNKETCNKVEMTIEYKPVKTE